MDTTQKVMIGISFAAGLTAAAIMVVSLIHSGIWFSKLNQEEEIEGLDVVADLIIQRAKIKKYSARVMFMEHCESRLETWEKLHGVKPWSENWTKYHERYHDLLRTKFI